MRPSGVLVDNTGHRADDDQRDAEVVEDTHGRRRNAQRGLYLTIHSHLQPACAPRPCRSDPG